MQAGLTVVDVYTGWAGPCNIMKPVVMKLKSKFALERGKDMVQYALACSDNIPDLRPFANVCK